MARTLADFDTHKYWSSVHTAPERNSQTDPNNTAYINRSGINWQLLQGLIISSTFACIVTLGHAVLFDLKANPRMVLHPWLLQHGFLQYANIADEHAPLLPQILAWLSPLWNGDALLTLQVVHACLILATVFGSVLWVYKHYGRWAAIATGAYFIAWSGLGGFWAMWYDLALCPLYLFIFINLVAPSPTTEFKLGRRALVVGLASGLALLIKQQAILVVALFIIWLVISRASGPRAYGQTLKVIALFLLGVSLPLITYLAYFWYQAGTLDALFYWIVEFNFTNGYSKLGLLLPTALQVQQALPAFWLLLPLGASLFQSKQSDLYSDRKTRLGLILFIAVSAVMQYPRYSTMHWATALPFIAIGAGIVCHDLLRVGLRTSEGQIIQRSIYTALVLLWLSGLATHYLPRLSGLPPRQLIEYDQLQSLAEQLKAKNLARGNFVLFPDNESVSNLYYLLDASPPKFWLMTYPWFMNEFTLAHWLESLETEKPKNVILFEGQFDWTSNQEALAYIQAHYQTVDVLKWQDLPVRIMLRRSPDNP